MNDETSRNKGIVLGLFDDIWNGPRFDLINEFYAPSFVADYRPYAPLRHGAEAVRTMVTAAWETFPDYYEELLSMIAEQNHVALYLRIVGSQRRAWGPLPATGRRLEFEEMSILTFDSEGKVTHQRGIVDDLAALRQAGVTPSPNA